METSNLPDIEFKIMVLRMLKKFRRRIDELSENLNKEITSMKKDIKSIKKNQSEMKNTGSEMKNTLEGINSRFD